MTVKSFLSDVMRHGLATMLAAQNAPTVAPGGSVLEDALAWLFAKSGQRLAFPSDEQFTTAVGDAFDAALRGLTMVQHDLALRRTVPLEVTRGAAAGDGEEQGGAEWRQRMRLLAFRAMRYLVSREDLCAGFVANATAAEYVHPPPSAKSYDAHWDEAARRSLLLEVLDEIVEQVFDKTDAVLAVTKKVAVFLESWRAMIEAGGEAKVREQLAAMGLLDADGQVREEGKHAVF